jgi:hypothetical protein
MKCSKQLCLMPETSEAANGQIDIIADELLDQIGGALGDPIWQNG